MSNWSNEEQRQSWQTHLVALKNRIANLEDGRADQSGAAGFLAVSKSSGIAVRLSVRSILGQLLHDGGEIEPDVLALDVAAVRKLHDVKQPEFEGAIASLEAERLARRPARPDRFVHHEVVAVEPLHATHLAVGKIDEHGLVEFARAVAAVRIEQFAERAVDASQRWEPGTIAKPLFDILSIHRPRHPWCGGGQHIHMSPPLSTRTPKN